MTAVNNFLKMLWRLPWLPARLKKAIYKKLSSSGAEPAFPFVKDFFGLRYEGNLNNSIEFSIYHYGAFEKPLLYFLGDTLGNIRRLLQKDNRRQNCFCDIGANIGQHSLFMSRIADQVHAFEPFDKVSTRLQHHIGLNQIGNIALHKIGLSDVSERLQFYAPTGRNQGIGSFDASTVEKGNQAAGELSLVCGDEYFERHPIPGVDLVKIDVEGFERRVLAGLRQTLMRWRPIIVCEINYGKDLSFGSLEAFRAALPENYALFAFDNRKTDGSKARRKGAQARKTGRYQLIPYTRWLESGQDDIIACPAEKQDVLPMQGTGRTPAA
ncbi:MAG: FkbM family methyltransferase [Proteobacteria bacterium]|nr:FkbM family methyltransferase [Pseudomonadota bacterium]